MSLKKSILKNGIATGFQKVAIVLNQLLLIPFFLQNWGAEYYGEYITLTIIPSVLAIADLGFGTAASSSMVLAYAGGKKDIFQNMAVTGFRVISGLIVIVISLSIIGLLTLDHLDFFDKAIIARDQGMWAVLLLMIARSIGFYQQFFEAYYRASRKAHLSIYLQSIYSIMTLIASILVLLLGGGIVELAAVTLALTIIYMPVYSIYARKSLSTNRDGTGEFSYPIMKNFIANGIGYLMAPSWQVVLLQGTTFVVRITLGPAMVALYTTVRTVASTITQLVSLMLGSTFPDLQFEIGAGRLKNAQGIFLYVTLLSALIGLISSLFLIFFGKWFYYIWTTNALKPPDIMWTIFMGGIFFKAVWFASGNVFRAYNKPFLLNMPCLIAALASLVISYVLITRIGITAVAYGTVFMDVILFFYVVYKASGLMRIKVEDYKEILKSTYDNISFSKLKKFITH